MRELQKCEIDAVDGGVAPLVVAGLWGAAKVIAVGVAAGAGYVAGSKLVKAIKEK